MQTISAKEFDTKFDNNEDISNYLDFSKSLKLKDFEKKVNKTKKINVDFPENILVLLDNEARLTLDLKVKPNPKIIINLIMIDFWVDLFPLWYKSKILGSVLIELLLNKSVFLIANDE